MKKCGRCGKRKPETEFTKHKECKNGFAGTCRKCMSLNGKLWKRKNSIRNARIRRERYAVTDGQIEKQREINRQEKFPLKTRCQLMRCGMRARARILKIEFDAKYFTVDRLIQLVGAQKTCPCCGRLFNIRRVREGCPNNDSPSIDRFKPMLGYTRSNVAIICWRCNNLKRDATADELEAVARWMRNKETE